MDNTLNQIKDFLIVITIEVGAIFLLYLYSLWVELRWINKHKNDKK